jgi:hypothetical protein
MRADQGSLHLRDARRYRGNNVDPLSINSATVDHDPSSGDVFLCLSEHDGDKIRIDRDLSNRTAAGCAEWLGKDALWSYRKEPDGLAIRSTSPNGAVAQRTLQDGRFTDVFATGLPISRYAESNIEVVVPTRAGLSTFAMNGSQQSIYPLKNRVPNAVHQLKKDKTVVVDDRGTLTLEGKRISHCSGLGLLLDQLPDGAVINRVERYDAEILEIGYTSGGKPGQALVSCNDNTDHWNWEVHDKFDQRIRIRGNRQRWEVNRFLLRIAWQDNRLIGIYNDGDWKIKTLLDQPINEPIRLLVGPERVFFLEEHELWSGKFDEILSFLYEGPSSNAVPIENLKSGVWELPSGLTPQIPPEVTTEIPKKSSDLSATIEDKQKIVQIKQSQLLLSILGYDTGVGDGLMGPQTRSAVMSFQSDVGLVPDGKITSKLILSMEIEIQERENSIETP